jgi:hypothetical protein
LYSLTGAFASIGEPGLRGMQLAAVQINEGGGALGRPIALAVRDVALTPWWPGADRQLTLEVDSANDIWEANERNNTASWGTDQYRRSSLAL